MAILLLKLVTNETVISDVATTPEGRFKLTKPVTLRLFPSNLAGGQPTLGFAPFPEFCDVENQQPVLLEPLHVVYTCKPDENMISEYNRMVDMEQSSTGIITG